MVIVEPSMSDEDIIAEINAEIGTMRSYGRRTENPPRGKPWRRVNWSNGSAEWWQYWDSMRGPRDLDANEFGVVGISRVKLEPLLSQLSPLPLYKGSYEARERGGFSFEGIEIPPGVKKAIKESEETEEPLDIQTQIALEEKIQRSGGASLSSRPKSSMKICSSCGREFEDLRSSEEKLLDAIFNGTRCLECRGKG